MGMDVYGKKAKSGVGEYFRNNVWWWHSLWEYCEKIAPDIIPKDNCGHSNDGWGLSCNGSLLLSERLTSLLESGKVKKYEEKYTKELSELPDEQCTICGGTGYRLPPPNVGPGNIKCNGCEGKGKVKNYRASYPFSEKNVEVFRDFLRDCGGFKIC